MLNIDYAPGAETSRLMSARKLYDRYGADLGRFKFLEIQLAIRNLRAAPKTGLVYTQDPYGIDIRYNTVQGYLIFYQIYETHIYIMDLIEDDEKLNL